MTPEQQYAAYLAERKLLMARLEWLDQELRKLGAKDGP